MTFIRNRITLSIKYFQQSHGGLLPQKIAMNPETYENLKAEIQSCADLRNFLQHNARLGEDFAAEPTEAAIAFVKELTAMVNNRPRCRDICVIMFTGTAPDFTLWDTLISVPRC